MRYNIKCITTTEEFRSLESDWKQLEKDSDNKNYNTSFDWIYTWWKVFKDRNDKQFGHKKELRILLLVKDDKLIGIAPFVKITRKTKYLIWKTSIEFIGQQWAGCFLDFIGKLINEESNMFFSWLYKNDKFDYIYLSYLPEWTDNFNLDENNIFLFSGCPVVGINNYNSFDDYYKQSLSKGQKQNLRTAKNKMFKQGINYNVSIDNAYNENIFNHLKEISLSKLRDKKNKHSTFTDADKQKFYSSILKITNRQIVFIKLNGKVAAYRTNIIYNNIKYCLDASYDRHFPQYNLGQLSVYESIKDSFNNNIAIHCEGAGLDYYKLKFCKDLVKVYMVIINGNTIIKYYYNNNIIIAQKAEVVIKKEMTDLDL